jgi:adhesin transport system membrane fusion protein
MSKNNDLQHHWLGHLDELAPQRTAHWTLRVAMIGIIVLVIWASVSKIDQVTRAPAQVIATDRTQVIQSPDPGVITKLLVNEGDKVLAGQLLAVLEKERAQAAVDDSDAKVAALRIALTRLEAEVYGKPLVFKEDLNKYEEYIRNQTALYQRRKTAINEDISSLDNILRLARQELRMNESLEKTGDVSRSELLRLQRGIADLEAQKTNKRNKYFQDAQTEMTKVQEDLNTQSEILRERSQILEQTEIKAPVDGYVKKINFTTLGAVVKPADIIMEILPTGSDLIVEAKIPPADIAFIEKGQSAIVKLDAYDYSIFGAMTGEVTYISPDTLTEETRNGPKPYYRVLIRIGAAEFKGANAAQIQVRPGMTATVDIKALERTVLSYLTKPLTRTLSNSLGER